MELRQIMPSFGAEVSGVNPCDLSDADFRSILDALDKHQLLLFRNLLLDPEQQAAFARRFDHDPSPPNYREFLIPGTPEVYRLGNVVENGEPIASLNPIGIEWHTDGTSRKLPCIVTLLYAVETPSQGGETLFACGYTAFEALDEETKRLLPKLRVRYNSSVLKEEIAKANDGTVHARAMKPTDPDVVHPIIRVHPQTGRTSLWATPREMRHVEGWTPEESFDFVNRLIEPGTADRYVYAHKWRPGDLVVWDNRYMLHSTTPYTYANERRLMHRVGLNGPSPVPPPDYVAVPSPDI